MPLPWNVQRVGNTRIWCHGALFLGPDCVFMFLIVCTIIVSTVLFLHVTDGLIEGLICGCASVATLGFMWRCSTMDPGICVKGEAPPESAGPQEPLMEPVAYLDASGRERYTLVERKWCFSCNIYRPLRCVHCRYCDNCIARRDHHCPWVGTCVGERNYRFYFFFLWSALFLTLIVMISCVLSLIRRSRLIAQSVVEEDKNVFLSALEETHFIEPLLVVVALVASCLVVPLAIFHTMLVSRNMTTTEETRRGTLTVHYFDRGGCCKNISASLCAPIPPSLFARPAGPCAPPTEVVVMMMDEA